MYMQESLPKEVLQTMEELEVKPLDNQMKLDLEEEEETE